MLARSLPPSLQRPPASLSPTHSHGERRAPRQPLKPLRPGPLKGHARAARPPPVGAPAAAGRPQAGAGRRARSCRRLPGTISAGPRAAKPPRPLPRAHRGGGGLRRDPAQPRAVGWQRRGNGPSPPGLYPSCPAAWEDLPARRSGARRDGVEGPPPGPPSSEVPRSPRLPSLSSFSLFLLLAFAPHCLFISPTSAGMETEPDPGFARRPSSRDAPLLLPASFWVFCLHPNSARPQRRSSAGLLRPRSRRPRPRLLITFLRK